MAAHLHNFGFMRDYSKWTFHNETCRMRSEFVMMTMIQIFWIMMITSKTCKIRTNCKYVYNLLGYFVSCTSIICFLFITNLYLNVIMY
jgi:hypothetical protein